MIPCKHALNKANYLKCSGVWSVAKNTRVKTSTSTMTYVDAIMPYMLRWFRYPVLCLCKDFQAPSQFRAYVSPARNSPHSAMC